jgi:hypothetical protein
VNISSEAVTGLKRQAKGTALLNGLADSLDYSDQGVRLAWNSIEGATGYRVCYKRTRDIGTNWVCPGTGFNTTTVIRGKLVDSLTVTMPASSFADGEEAEFAVIGYNKMYETKLAGAATLRVKDEVGPGRTGDDGISGNKYSVGYDFNYTPPGIDEDAINDSVFFDGTLSGLETALAQRAASLQTSDLASERYLPDTIWMASPVIFSEPLDTTAAPDVKIVGTGTPPLPRVKVVGVYRNGSNDPSDRHVRIGFTVDALTAATQSTNERVAIIELAPVKDKAGNTQKTLIYDNSDTPAKSTNKNLLRLTVEYAHID